MLTFEENEWNFQAFKILSTLNFLPIEIDGENGKIRIQNESNKMRLLRWRILFSLAVTHCCYMLLRLGQSTLVEPEKYFRWDHFILHLPFAFAYSIFHFTGFSMFVANPRELVIIFNHLFVERENPVQKMMDEEKELEKKTKNEQETSCGGKSARKIESRSASAQNQIQVAVCAVDPKSSRIRPLFTWPPLYSLDELLARLLSFALLAAASLALVVLAADPQRPQLLYSAVPPEYQNFGSFLGLFSVEIISISVIIVSALFSIVTELLFFGKCQSELQQLDLQLRTFVEKFGSRSDLNRDIRREIWILRQISKGMKELVLFIELFNRCFPFCIFAFKIACLLASILFYFFTIRHGRDFTLLGVFTSYAAVGITVCYTIQYQNAFSIPQKIEQLKRDFLLSAQNTRIRIQIQSKLKSKPAPQNLNPMPNTNTTKNLTLIQNGRFLKEMQSEIRGIRNVGVKVGNFHTLERESTPNFINFVMTNVANLLVTFKR